MKNKPIILLIASMATVFFSCMQSPKGDRVQASDVYIIEAYNHGNELKADVEKSNIEWLGTKPTGTHNGTLGIKEGSIFIKDGVMLGGKFTMDMNKIIVLDIENPGMNSNLVNHLRSSDFFLVDSFPNAYFEFSKAIPLNDTPEIENEFIPTHRIEGNLTLRGITKGISFAAKINYEEGIFQATTPQFIINRTFWNVNYGSRSIFANLKDNFIHDEIGIKINLTAH